MHRYVRDKLYALGKDGRIKVGKKEKGSCVDDLIILAGRSGSSKF